MKVIEKKMVRFHNVEEEYKVSPDIAGKVLKYFIDQYNEQYPDLKDSRYKGPMNISDIDKGVAPTLKWINVKSKDNIELNYDLKKGENENEIRSLLKNMTNDEYKVWSKRRQKELYKDSSEKSDLENKNVIEKWTGEMIKLSEKYGIIPESKIWDNSYMI